MGAAIVAAVGAIFGGIASIVGSNNARKAAYQAWLAANVPEYTDVFGNYKSQKDQTGVIIIAVLAFLAVVLIITFSIKTIKK